MNNQDTNLALINAFTMLTKRIDELEDKQIKIQEQQTKKILQHYYSSKRSTCSGEIFDVHCPVIHINGPIRPRDPEGGDDEYSACQCGKIQEQHDGIYAACVCFRNYELTSVYCYFARQHLSKAPFDMEKLLTVAKSNFPTFMNLGWVEDSDYDDTNYLALIFYTDGYGSCDNSKVFIDLVKNIFHQAGMLDYFTSNVSEIRICYEDGL